MARVSSMFALLCLLISFDPGGLPVLIFFLDVREQVHVVIWGGAILDCGNLPHMIELSGPLQVFLTDWRRYNMARSVECC